MNKRVLFRQIIPIVVLLLALGAVAIVLKRSSKPQASSTTLLEQNYVWGNVTLNSGAPAVGFTIFIGGIGTTVATDGSYNVIVADSNTVPVSFEDSAAKPFYIMNQNEQTIDVDETQGTHVDFKIDSVPSVR